jgi:hypothetical protein
VHGGRAGGLRNNKQRAIHAQSAITFFVFDAINAIDAFIVQFDAFNAQLSAFNAQFGTFFDVQRNRWQGRVHRGVGRQDFEAPGRKRGHGRSGRRRCAHTRGEARGCRRQAGCIVGHLR